MVVADMTKGETSGLSIFALREMSPEYILPTLRKQREETWFSVQALTELRHHQPEFGGLWSAKETPYILERSRE